MAVTSWHIRYSPEVLRVENRRQAKFFTDVLYSGITYLGWLTQQMRSRRICS